MTADNPDSINAAVSQRMIADAFGITEEEMMVFTEYLDATGYTEAKRQSEEDRAAYLVWAEKRLSAVGAIAEWREPEDCQGCGATREDRNGNDLQSGLCAFCAAGETEAAQ